MANPWQAQKSKNKTPLWFRSGRLLLPIMPLQVSPLLPTVKRPFPEQLEVPWRQPSCSLQRIPTHWRLAGDLRVSPHPPGASHLGLFWKSTKSSPSLEAWFQSQSNRLSWAQLYLVGTAEPTAPALACSLPKRLHSMSLEPVCAASSQHAQFPAVACYPAYNAPDPDILSCRSWAHRANASCYFFGLCPTGAMGQDPAARHSLVSCPATPGSGRVPQSPYSRQGFPAPCCICHRSLWNRSLSDHSPETTLPWVTLSGAFASDNRALRITGGLKPLNCDKVAIHVCIINHFFNLSNVILQYSETLNFWFSWALTHNHQN